MKLINTILKFEKYSNFLTNRSSIFIVDEIASNGKCYSCKLICPLILQQASFLHQMGKLIELFYPFTLCYLYKGTRTSYLTMKLFNSITETFIRLIRWILPLLLILIVDRKLCQSCISFSTFQSDLNESLNYLFYLTQHIM